MIFGKIDHIILLGGSRCAAELSLFLKEKSEFKFDVYTSPRQLDDVIYSDGTTLGDFFSNNNISLNVSENINLDSNFVNSITKNTLGIGLGEAWSFEKNVIDKFEGKLIDLMGVRMPQYRGVAHYTWQILRGNKIGACNLQVINEEMIQGVFDSGQIIKFKEYLFPNSTRIPNDYFNHAVKVEIEFIKEFIDQISNGFIFKDFILQENFSIFFPRLNTIKNAFINWQWDTDDIETMICAFDEPYAGVTSSVNGKLVRLKSARSEKNDGSFHPFQSGLIYKIYNGDLYVASKQGTIIISEVYDESAESIIHELKTGDRFFTPNDWIEKGLSTSIKY